MIERYTPAELNTITQIIAEQIPLDFTYQEALAYQKDYYKALVNFKKEFKEEKNLCEFGNHNSTKDKLRTSCKECRKIESKIYRESNPERIKETAKNWYNKNPNYNKEYYLKNFEKLNEKNKQWYKLNTEKHKENSKKWNENNKEKMNEYYNNRIKIIRKKDPINNLKFNVRTRIYNIFSAEAK
jgi:hypothetical protein